MAKVSFLSSLLVCVIGFVSQTASAATVQYSGKVFTANGSPIVGGYVIVGTFAPGIDPFNYNCIYGDEVCNQNPGAYDSAVSDGNFFPIGAGTLTDPNGVFNTSGSTNTPAGTPIWLFAFADDTRGSFLQVLASSSNPAWQTPAQPTGFTFLNASDADMFVMGTSHPQGVTLGEVPVPESASLTLSILGGLAVLGASRWKNRLS